MQEDIKRNIWINAPRERVWQAITDPKLIQQWFSPGTPWALTELAVGGKVYAVGYESQASTIQVIDPPRQFTYRWASQPPDAPLSTTSTYILDEENGGTRVTFTEIISGDLLEEARRKRITDYDGGYKIMLENMKAYLEGETLPYPEGL